MSVIQWCRKTRRYDEMKFGYYIMSGRPRVDYESVEHWRKLWEELREALKPTGLELVFYGSPFGTSEGEICVLKGEVTDFEKMWGTGIGKKFPMTDQRTTFVLV